MRNHTLVRTRMKICFGLAAILVALACHAVAQITTYSAITETQDSTGNSSERIQQTRIETGGRTIDTHIVQTPSVNGGYALVNAIETETTHDGRNSVHVVERWYVPDGNGRRQLARIVETETTAVPGKSTTTTRTRYDSDLDGHLQAMERDTEESIPLNAFTTQTTTAVFLLRGNIFSPVQQTVTVTTRKESGLTDVQRMVSLADQSGKFIPTLITHGVEKQTGTSRTKEEHIARADAGKVPGEGQMSPIQRTVTQEWKAADGQEHSQADTYTLFTIGVAPDGELHLNRQVSIVSQVMADGSTHVIQHTADINPGAKTDRPRFIETRTEVSRRGTAGVFETITIVQAPNSSGTMQPFWTSDTHGFERGND